LTTRCLLAKDDYGIPTAYIFHYAEIMVPANVKYQQTVFFETCKLVFEEKTSLSLLAKLSNKFLQLLSNRCIPPTALKFRGCLTNRKKNIRNFFKDFMFFSENN